jgi:predicted oxidoreductase (fatty acid repression mutant protein)
VVTASWTARVWDALTGQPVTPPLEHKLGVPHAAFSPDGRWVVTASHDETARVWDALTGEPVTPALQHYGSVVHADFSPDGRRVVTASQDRTARVWDALTGQPITPPLEHQSWVSYAAFSPDGRRVVTASQDKTARVWDLSPDDRPAHDWLAMVRLSAGCEIDAAGGLQPLRGERLKSMLETLRAKYPQDFTPAQERAWREEQVGQCLKEGNLGAAFFHYHSLIAEMVAAAGKK